MPSLVLIGDSIRMQYQPLVARILGQEVATWGPVENCETSTKVLEKIDEWLAGRSPDLVHLNCGLHDLRIDPGHATHRVPIDVYAQNIRRIVSRLRDRGLRVMWATTTPVIDQRHLAVKPSRRYEADVIAYNEAALTVARELSIAVNDLHAAVISRGAEDLIGVDGVHFTDEGYAVLAEHIVAAVRAVLR